jgi:CheY-like chemotaxis protein
MALASEFDAIVLDLMLPGIDGYAGARQLRKRGNQTRSADVAASFCPFRVTTSTKYLLNSEHSGTPVLFLVLTQCANDSFLFANGRLKHFV